MSREIDFSKPLNKADKVYLADRPWMLVDARLRGEFDADPEPEEDESEEDESEEEETEEVESWDDLTIPELKAEIEARNAAREDEDTHVVVATDAKKADLVSALEADDSANPA